MDEKFWGQIKSLSGIEDGSRLELIFNTLADQAPVIGKILTTYKIHRLSQRLKANESKIDEISEKVSQIDDAKFVDLLKNFLFPTVLQELLDEDEDNKIGYFLDGFGQVVDNRINDKSKILIYYDVLMDLRFIEIEYLISFSSEYRSYRSKLYHESGNREETIFNTKAFQEMKYAIENKLEKLGLIDTGRSISYDEIMKRLDETILRVNRRLPSPSFNDKAELTGFGYHFLKFFSLLDRYRE